MSMFQFLANPEWDAPFFKLLAHNDTGQAPGHQGGMVFPKELRQYLPLLDETGISTESPTVDRKIRAEMFVGSMHLTDGIIRYQIQTWGGTRSAESRLTDGLRPLRDRAIAGDIMLFQRRVDALDHFRLVLVKQGSPEFIELAQWINGRHWGPLFSENKPVTQSLLLNAQHEIVELESLPFNILRPDITRIESRQIRIARNSVFRERVSQEYEKKCAVSGILIATPTMMYEVESAHVVPVSKGGTDDIRNGLALTQTLHWAFDHGLFGISSDRRVIIPHKVKQMSENDFLRQYENKPIKEARTEHLRVHREAFKWHFDNLVRQWA
jgi:putative restriction endonuclease